MMDHEFQKIPLQRLENNKHHIESECIVQESTITLHYNTTNGEKTPHVTLLGTPAKIKELHIGHIYCEGLTTGIPTTDLIEFQIADGKVDSFYHSEIISKPDHRIITTSCGACNHPDLSVNPNRENMIAENNPLSHNELRIALETMRKEMELFQKTGGCHGAGLLSSIGNVSFVSEDIGRHNAVDKAIGTAILSGVERFGEYTLLLSGRCGWDIVAKAVRIGIPAIASVGAFSTAALNLARDNGICLYGFVRESGAWKAGLK